MNKAKNKNLSRREREIMDVVYHLGEGGVSEIRARMNDNPAYDTIRVILGILSKKGHLVRYQEVRRFIYRAKVSKEIAARTAIRNLLTTFFSGAPSKAVLAMLDESSNRLTREELDEIKARIKNEE